MAYHEPEHGVRLPHGPTAPSHQGWPIRGLIGVAIVYGLWLMTIITMDDKPGFAKLFGAWLIGAGLCGAWIILGNLPTITHHQ